MTKRIVFLTGSRADFGKIKSLIEILQAKTNFDVHLFVTGMHTLKKYGSTSFEIERQGYPNIYKYINQNLNDSMDSVLAKTVSGFSDYIKEVEPDMIIVHGDRLEALAGATVGCFNNILVTHIEGGEVSGTVDELIRHAVTKMSHLHLVANEEARGRLIQLGERPESIFVIGSPDMDIMLSDDLPDISTVKHYYDIPHENYGVVLLHPVTTEVEHLQEQADIFVNALIESNREYVVIYPNNDHGSDVIFKAYNQLKGNDKFRVFPSMRFEYFLTLMKEARFIVGNSSAGIREAPVYGVPCLNVGSRQNKRSSSSSIINVDFNKSDILQAIEDVEKVRVEATTHFGSGESDQRFYEILSDSGTWEQSTQKTFVDI